MSKSLTSESATCATKSNQNYYRAVVLLLLLLLFGGRGVVTLTRPTVQAIDIEVCDVETAQCLSAGWTGGAVQRRSFCVDQSLDDRPHRRTESRETLLRRRVGLLGTGTLSEPCRFLSTKRCELCLWCHSGHKPRLAVTQEALKQEWGLW